MAEKANSVLDEFRSLLGPSVYNELIPYYVEEHLAEQSDETYVCDYLNKHFGIRCSTVSGKHWIDEFSRSYMYKMQCVNLTKWSSWKGPKKKNSNQATDYMEVKK